MPMQTEKTYNHHQKQLHFIEAVQQLWDSKTFTRANLSRICRRVATLSAPQFYITPKQALEQYNRYKHTGRIYCKNPHIRQMYIDIFERYEQQVSNGDDDFKYIIMQNVLSEPAPSFYINPNNAMTFYYRAMKYKRMLTQEGTL